MVIYSCFFGKVAIGADRFSAVGKCAVTRMQSLLMPQLDVN